MDSITKFFCTIAIVCFVSTSAVFADYAWLEKKINSSDGAASDAFGCSTAISGEYAVVGAYKDESSKGAAYIFKRISGVWTQQRKLVASDGAAGDCFGISVGISGNYIIVGANAHNSSRGAAYMYKLNDTTWNQKLTASDAASGDLFGQSVSIYGSYAAVGAEGETSKKGAVYIFVWDTDNANWTQLQIITPNPRVASARFGCSVSMDSESMLIGAYNDSSVGAAYLYSLSSGTWSGGLKFTASDAANSDNFGCSVAICGDYAVIGAYNGNNNLSVETGSVYIFKPYTFSSWDCSQELVPSDGAAGDLFGRSVSINGNYIVIGAPGNGASYVFSLGGSTWSQSKKLTASAGATDDFFGSSVCTDGTYVICGDVNDDDFGTNSGSAYIYEYSEIGTLTLLAPNGGENFAAGSNTNITWSSTGPVESVEIDYSINNAGTWTTIAAVSNTGSYEWTVADANSTQCRIRITGAGASDVYDTSNNLFTIYQCALNFDANNDCVVDFIDFADFASEWLMCGNPADANCIQ